MILIPLPSPALDLEGNLAILVEDNPLLLLASPKMFPQVAQTLNLLFNVTIRVTIRFLKRRKCLLMPKHNCLQERVSTSSKKLTVTIEAMKIAKQSWRVNFQQRK